MIESSVKIVSIIFIFILPFISYRNWKMEVKNQNRRACYFWKILFIISSMLLIVGLLPVFIYFYISR